MYGLPQSPLHGRETRQQPLENCLRRTRPGQGLGIFAGCPQAAASSQEGRERTQGAEEGSVTGLQFDHKNHAPSPNVLSVALADAELCGKGCAPNSTAQLMSFF